MDIRPTTRGSLHPYNPGSRFFALGFCGLVVFPIFCFASIIVFWSKPGLFALSLGFFTIAHLLFVLLGLVYHRLASATILPALLLCLVVFGYNRHTTGQEDHSPFSDGIGTVPQRMYGLLPYYREFQSPFPPFGERHLDWAAVFANLELCVAGILACGLVLRLFQFAPGIQTVTSRESCHRDLGDGGSVLQPVSSQSPRTQGINPYQSPLEASTRVGSRKQAGP